MNSPQPKRAEILAAATERFGRDGYEDTKWADIAADVGVGATALYHYFESKQHCLFEIMGEAIEDFHRRLELVVEREPDALHAAAELLRTCFALTPHEVQRNRVLVAEQGLLAEPGTSPREEHARLAVRARVRDLEHEWASFLSHAMDQGAIPRDDARLLARAALGLFNSIWAWYRPFGILELPLIADFYSARILAMLGVAPDAAAERAAA